MKALAAVAIIVGGVLAPEAGAHAKPSVLEISSIQHAFHRLQHLPDRGRVALAGGEHALPRQVQSGVVKDAGQLKVPANVYPSDFTVGGQTMTATDADDQSFSSSGLYFAYIHYLIDQGGGGHFSYKDNGMLFGYAEVAFKTLPDQENLFLEYLASAYTSPDSAAGAFSSLLSYYNTLGQYVSGATVKNCSFPGADQCVELNIKVLATAAGNSETTVVRLLQKSNSLWEGGYFLPTADQSAFLSQAQKPLEDMSSAFVALFTSSSGGGSTSTPIPAPTLQLRPTSTPTRVAPSPTPTASPTLAPRPLQPTKTPTPRPPKPTATSKPTPRPTARPSTHLKVVLSFDRLLATDGRGRVPRTFALGQDVRIVATYSVRNLKRGHILTGRIFRTFQVVVKGRVQQQVQNSDQLVVVKSGTYRNDHDTGGFQRRGTIRVVVRITFKKLTQTKSVAVYVR